MLVSKDFQKRFGCCEERTLDIDALTLICISNGTVSQR